MKWKEILGWYLIFTAVIWFGLNVLPLGGVPSWLLTWPGTALIYPESVIALTLGIGSLFTVGLNNNSALIIDIASGGVPIAIGYWLMRGKKK